MKTQKEPCWFCGGTGWRQCLSCNGTGKQFAFFTFDRDREIERKCPSCGGSGKVKCTFCDGKGYVKKPVFEIPVESKVWGSFDSNRQSLKHLKVDSIFKHSEPIISKIRPLGLEEQEWSKGFGIRTEITPKTASASAFSEAPSKPEHFVETPSSLSGVVFITLILTLFVAAYLLETFGFKRTIVATEAFFLFAGWGALRAASLFGTPASNRLKIVADCAAIGFGLGLGALAFYLVLTTTQGQVLTEWVTAQISRLIGSLFGSAFGLGTLELIWRKVLQWITGEM